MSESDAAMSSASRILRSTATAFDKSRFASLGSNKSDHVYAEGMRIQVYSLLICDLIIRHDGRNS